jgi:hypothetical protein
VITVLGTRTRLLLAVDFTLYGTLGLGGLFRRLGKGLQSILHWHSLTPATSGND